MFCLVFKIRDLGISPFHEYMLYVINASETNKIMKFIYKPFYFMFILDTKVQ